ncbi:hypothetical protein BCR37DRAFT_41946 [Protomyces lactucae-debilis]|uniref:HotDog domain-containing protein n=1 Tax=Protomyces lactucae-debilis TaxID=2754530 RepID=A0A1Y2FDH4_PROLT|nr:uncharacterized protein BCR37DRAFT_41946 [Protomyces lactucae-debilis]ORY81366.1 hypothetical protein BCR37DRAFT_41946 [Protomyces lactucae-debilis]
MQPTTALQPGEHFLFWNEMVPETELHADGYHGFQAPQDGTYRHRLWQSGSIDFLKDIEAGIPSTCTETATAERQDGSTAVTTTRDIVQHNQMCLTERRTLLYTDILPSSRKVRAPAAALKCSQRVLVPSEVLLFRYAALTNNGHRIHYDKQYTQQVEGYSNILVQGSLNVTLLLQHLASQLAPSQHMTHCEYKMISPCYVGETLRYCVENSLSGKIHTRAYILGQHGDLKLQLSATLIS